MMSARAVVIGRNPAQLIAGVGVAQALTLISATNSNSQINRFAVSFGIECSLSVGGLLGQTPGRFQLEDECRHRKDDGTCQQEIAADLGEERGEEERHQTKPRS